MMKKRDKIIYWVATIWLALGMTSSGIMQIIQNEDVLAGITHLGYPAYFIILLGTWKILGSIAILVPKFPLLKEWAYAGFFFTVTGALYSHFVLADPFGEIFPGLLLLLLTVVSWYFRPANRKVNQSSNAA